jgi:hypothetical protein
LHPPSLHRSDKGDHTVDDEEGRQQNGQNFQGYTWEKYCNRAKEGRIPSTMNWTAMAMGIMPNTLEMRSSDRLQPVAHILLR